MRRKFGGRLLPGFLLLEAHPSISASSSWNKGFDAATTARNDGAGAITARMLEMPIMKKPGQAGFFEDDQL